MDQFLAVIQFADLIRWVGNFHPVILHFPIAMIIMGGIAELFDYKYPSPYYSNASRFMIMAAAFTALPTALLGLALGYGLSFPGPLSSVFWWHRFFGLSTAGMAIYVALLRERYEKNKSTETLSNYRTWLTFLIFFVITTAYLGGEMTFGLNHFFNIFSQH